MPIRETELAAGVKDGTSQAINLRLFRSAMSFRTKLLLWKEDLVRRDKIARRVL